MIEVKELRKAFGPIVAVDGVSFSVGQGDVLGFLGPNGAGKTTTMKMLSCFLAPDRGTATIAGRDIRRDPVGVRAHIGYLAENAPAYEEMTPASFLRFVCATRGLRGPARDHAVDRVVSSCAIAEVLHQPIGTLSKGYRRRVGLAQALVHDPQVLLLDEPTDGLDPNQKHDVRELIKGMAATKCTIVSTHILEEVDAICNRIILIHEGQILADSTPEQMRERYQGRLDEVFRRLTTGQAAQAAAGGGA